MSFLLNPFVFAGAAGDFESIATVTVGAGGAASIEFTSIPGTYQHLQVRVLLRSDYLTGAGGYLELNGDTSSSYRNHILSGNGSSASGTDWGALTLGMGCGYDTGSSSLSNTFAASVIDILDYANTSKNTTVRMLSGKETNGAGNVGVWSGLYVNTGAVTQIKFKFGGAAQWVQHSTAALYGIKA